jgi:uncharacterized protein (TIGR02246 family)
MCKVIVLSILIVVLMSGVGPADAATEPGNGADRVGVAQVVDQFVEAWNQEDVEAFLRLFAPNGALITPQSTATSREAIKRLVTEEHRDLFFGTVLSQTIDMIRFSGAAMAEVAGKYVLCCIKAFWGFTVSPKGSFELQLSREDDRWAIERARIHTS